MARKGIWIVAEGIDGAGKSTLVQKLIEWFGQRVCTTVRQTSEPTSERYGRLFQTRMRLHLTGQDDFSFEDQIQLLTRDRMTHTAMINQWLSDGAVVIQDRFWPSTLAYQGQKVDVVSLYQMHQWLFTPGPDLMIWLDTPVKEAVSRLERRGGKDEFVSMLTGAHEIYSWLHDQGNTLRVNGLLAPEDQVRQVVAHLIDNGMIHL